MWYVFIGMGVGIMLIPPTMLLAVLSTGFGHGNYLWAKVFFPYSMVLPVWRGVEIGLPLILLAFVQFPVYGGLIGACSSSVRGAAAVATIIGIVHVVAVAVCFASKSNYFS
jgi:hypothetical protein